MPLASEKQDTWPLPSPDLKHSRRASHFADAEEEQSSSTDNLTATTGGCDPAMPYSSSGTPASRITRI